MLFQMASAASAETNATVSAETSADEEQISVTEPQPCSSTATQSVTQPSVGEVVQPESRRKKKTMSEDDKCTAAMGKYFSARACAISTAAAAKPPSTEKKTDNEAFCAMICTEMEKVQSSAIKRDLKRKLLDAVFAAQELEEQQSVVYLVQGETGQTTQIGVPLVQQTPDVGTSAEGAQVLLQLAQQPQ